MRDVDIAYAAGFFDGEGHVRCDIHNGYPMLKVSVSQQDPQPLDWLQTLFGGRVYFRTVGSTKYRFKTNGCHTWQIHTTDAYLFLDVVLPYLMVKKQEAEEAMTKWNERPAAQRAQAQS